MDQFNPITDNNSETTDNSQSSVKQASPDNLVHKFLERRGLLPKDYSVFRKNDFSREIEEDQRKPREFSRKR